MKNVIVFYFFCLLLCSCSGRKTSDKFGNNADTTINRITTTINESLLLKFVCSDVELYNLHNKSEEKEKTNKVAFVISSTNASKRLDDLNVDVANDSDVELSYAYHDYYRKTDKGWSMIPLATHSLGWIIPKFSKHRNQYRLPVNDELSPGQYKLYMVFDYGTRDIQLQASIYFEIVN